MNKSMFELAITFVHSLDFVRSWKCYQSFTPTLDGLIHVSQKRGSFPLFEHQKSSVAWVFLNE